MEEVLTDLVALFGIATWPCGLFASWISSMKPPQILFMIYDSRSGSTMLARKLAEELGDVAVTPEIGFDSLLRRSERAYSRSGALEVVRLLYCSGDFRNIGVEQAELEKSVQSMQEPIVAADLVRCSLEMWRNSVGQSASHIIVKNGTHAKYWKSIMQIWPNTARILFVFRDPRAVISSKLRTVRPYHKHEVMAWGGTLLAAWRWREYSSQMRLAAEAGVRVLNVKYETLLASPEIEMDRIAAFVGVEKVKGRSDGKYDVPVAERGIHTLVTAGGIRKERGGAWLQELTRFDCAVVESACQKEMSNRGYDSTVIRGRLASMFYLLAEFPRMVLKIGRHYLYVLARHDR